MITLRLQSDFLFQVHKNHVAGKIQPDCKLRLTSAVNKKEIETADYTLSEYFNFYLFSLSTNRFKPLDKSATLEILDGANSTVLYSSPITIN